MSRPTATAPLDAADLAVLRWLRESPAGRCFLDCPPGLDPAIAAVTRRAMVRRLLVTLDCPVPTQPAVYLLTAAGEELLERIDPTPHARKPRADPVNRWR